MSRSRPVTQLVDPVRSPDDRLLNHIAILVDESGSMAHLSSVVFEVVHEQLGNIKNAARNSGQETLVSVYSFNDRAIRRHCVEVFPEAASFGSYKPGGWTPLLDSLDEVMTDLSKAGRGGSNESFLVVTITDGQENRSSSRNAVRTMKGLQDGGKWSFAFLAPPGGKDFLARLGVPLGNIREWEQSEAGLREASRVTTASVDSYYATRSTGETKTESFFTDLSGVKQKDLDKLDDLSGEFYRWKVEREMGVADFVEGKVGSYRPGGAYYELTKPEKIQSHKRIILATRVGKALYGGAQARALLGVTSGPGVTVSVRPGNHSNYRVFVQSTSTNRKLVRGTDLLYQK